jgi:hypothetical protein
MACKPKLLKDVAKHRGDARTCLHCKTTQSASWRYDFCWHCYREIEGGVRYLATRARML